MYRYSVDNTMTFSADDLVLFLESPFASWMERLTLENPGHGIPPDTGGEPPASSARPQHAFAATLRASGRSFVQIDWNQQERKRRTATLEAMRNGADFIVDGQLAAGSLAGPVNLLMRTSGFSELGDYLYLPCDTAGDDKGHVGLRLCFIADLLHGVQGQLPPKLLVVRRDSELSAMATEDHIHYYRAVKQRFIVAQRDFRRHRMPDPAQSSHCGRWYDCANEVIRQRLQNRHEPEAVVEGPQAAGLNASASGEAPPVNGRMKAPEAPLRLADIRGDTPKDSRGEWWRHYLDRRPEPPRAPASGRGETLAEQASLLAGQGAAGAGQNSLGDDPSSRLEPLRFIGESDDGPPALLDGHEARHESPSLDEIAPPQGVPGSAPGLESPEAIMAPPGVADHWTVDAPASESDPAPHPLDSPGFSISAHIRLAGRRAGASAVAVDSSRADRAGSERYKVLTPVGGGESTPPISERLNTRDSFEG